MTTKVTDATIENIDFGNETIILNGAPTRLSGTVHLHNKNENQARVRYLDLKPTNGKSLNKLGNLSLYINTKLRAGETKLQPLSVALPPETPPGTYHQFIEVKGKKKEVKLVVQATINVTIQPNEFTLQGTAPGTQHQVAFTVSNMGNLDFQIPNPKHVAALDMDMLCRAFGIGVRDKKAEGFNATLDQITKILKEQLPNWADAKIAEAGEIIKPGKQMLVNFSFTMPKEARVENDYDLNVRFWDQELSFVIKSHQESKNT